MTDFKDIITMQPTVKQPIEEFPIEGDMSGWMVGSEQVSTIDVTQVQENDEDDSLSASASGVTSPAFIKFQCTGGKSGIDYVVEVQFTTDTGRKLAADFPIKVRG